MIQNQSVPRPRTACRCTGRLRQDCAMYSYRLCRPERRVVLHRYVQAPVTRGHALRKEDEQLLC
jgi:hypothetical protein